MKALSGYAANIAKALYTNACSLQVQVAFTGRLGSGNKHTAPSGLLAAQTTAQSDGFACDNPTVVGAIESRIGIHHPGHDLTVGIYIRRRNIMLRTNDRPYFRSISAGDACQFLSGIVLGIDAHPSFGSPERDINGGTFDRHPGRERHHLAQIDLRMKAYATFARPPGNIMLHAVAFKMGNVAVIQLNGDIHDEYPLGPFERFCPAGQLTQMRDDPVDLF